MRSKHPWVWRASQRDHADQLAEETILAGTPPHFANSKPEPQKLAYILASFVSPSPLPLRSGSFPLPACIPCRLNQIELTQHQEKRAYQSPSERCILYALAPINYAMSLWKRSKSWHWRSRQQSMLLRYAWAHKIPHQPFIPSSPFVKVPALLAQIQSPFCQAPRARAETKPNPQRNRKQEKTRDRRRRRRRRRRQQTTSTATWWLHRTERMTDNHQLHPTGCWASFSISILRAYSRSRVFPSLEFSILAGQWMFRVTKRVHFPSSCIPVFLRSWLLISAVHTVVPCHAVPIPIPIPIPTSNMTYGTTVGITQEICEESVNSLSEADVQFMENIAWAGLFCCALFNQSPRACGWVGCAVLIEYSRLYRAKSGLSGRSRCPGWLFLSFCAFGFLLLMAGMHNGWSFAIVYGVGAVCRMDMCGCWCQEKGGKGKGKSASMRMSYDFSWDLLIVFKCWIAS